MIHYTTLPFETLAAVAILSSTRIATYKWVLANIHTSLTSSGRSMALLLSKSAPCKPLRAGLSNQRPIPSRVCPPLYPYPLVARSFVAKASRDGPDSQKSWWDLAKDAVDLGTYGIAIMTYFVSPSRMSLINHFSVTDY
jgi:hypothetical protein